MILGTWNTLVTTVLLQITRRRSTGDYDQVSWVRLIQGRYEEEYFRDDGLCKIVGTYNYSQTNNLGTELSERRITELKKMDAETNLEEEIYPGMFGLIENPGVLQLCCVDYPPTVNEYYQELNFSHLRKYNSRRRVNISYDDISQYFDTDDKKCLAGNKVSRSLNSLTVL